MADDGEVSAKEALTEEGATEKKDASLEDATDPVRQSVSLDEIDDDTEMDQMQAAFDPRLVDMVTPAGARDLEAVYSVPVTVTAVLGKARIQVADLLKMKRGTVIELDRKVGEPIDIYVNGRLVARGEVVVVKEKLGITMTEIIKSDNF